jgi:hypothetical protein
VALGAGLGALWLVVAAKLLRDRRALERIDAAGARRESLLGYVDRVVDRELATALREAPGDAGRAAVDLDDLREAVARSSRRVIQKELDHVEFQHLLQRMIHEKLAAEARDRRAAARSATTRRADEDERVARVGEVAELAARAARLEPALHAE